MFWQHAMHAHARARTSPNGISAPANRSMSKARGGLPTACQAGWRRPCSKMRLATMLAQATTETHAPRRAERPLQLHACNHRHARAVKLHRYVALHSACAAHKQTPRTSIAAPTTAHGPQAAHDSVNAMSAGASIGAAARPLPRMAYGQSYDGARRGAVGMPAARWVGRT